MQAILSGCSARLRVAPLLRAAARTRPDWFALRREVNRSLGAGRVARSDGGTADSAGRS